jgi:hypothetical protein
VSEDEAPRSEPGHGTPEGYTSEKPAPSEEGEPGAPADPHHDEAVTGDEYHEAPTHMDAHTSISDDDHGHGEVPLGPIDWGAWGVAVVSGGAALLVVVLFWVATLPHAVAV